MGHTHASPEPVLILFLLAHYLFLTVFIRLGRRTVSGILTASLPQWQAINLDYLASLDDRVAMPSMPVALSAMAGIKSPPS